MADRVVLQDRSAIRFPKDGLIATAVLLTIGVALRFLFHYALPYFRFDRAYFGYYWPHRVRLIFHICGGILALSCGPFQFWTGLRQRAMTIHAWTGRLYLVGVLVGSTGAFLMSVFTTPRSFGVALIFLASAWIVVTGIAYAAILRGIVTLHKEWMVRSYLVTFAFVSFRLLHDNLPAVAKHLGESENDVLANITWISWLLPLAIYEVIRQSRKIMYARRVA